jgi:hypothetical protein
MDEWSDAELDAAVMAYIEMAKHEEAQRPYVKKQYLRELASQFNRTDKAFEYRMQNISAVLDQLGRRWIPGFKPAPHVGTRVASRIEQAISRAESEKPQKIAPQAAYKEKLPAMRDWLINLARARGKVAYSEMMLAFGVDRFSLRFAMDYLGHQAQNQDEPVLTALIVGKSTGRCSPGLEKEFGVTDDEAERQALYAYWSAEEATQAPQQETTDSLKARAAKFASVEVRPDQAAFRRLVYEKFDGVCALSGCEVRQALDAAHYKGRDWRKGHNGAEDGFLVRKDLHALYDAGLLRITADGVVECDVAHYAQFNGLIRPILALKGRPSEGHA